MRARTARDELDRAVVILLRTTLFWRRAVMVFIATLVIAVPFALTRPRLYRSEALILYRETMRSTDIVGGEGGGESARRLGARLKEMLVARGNLERIILDLGLYPAIIEQRGIVDAIEEMRKKINFRAREGDTFMVQFEGTDAEIVERVATRLSESMVKEAELGRSEQAKRLKDFLDLEATRNAEVLRAKEADLARFLGKHPEFALPGKARTMGVGPRKPVDPSVGGLEARASRLERRLRAAAVPGAAPPPRVERLTVKDDRDTPEVTAARKELAEKLAHFTEKHPDVVQAKRRLNGAIEAARAQATSEAARAVRLDPPLPEPGAEEDVAALRRELADVNAQLVVARAKLGPSAASKADEADNATVALEVEFRRLQREVSEMRDRQQNLDDKRFKASITAKSVTDDRNVLVSILDPAYRPKHAVSTGKTVLLGGALLVAGLLALMTALLSAILDDRLHDFYDLETLNLVPVVGVIPSHGNQLGFRFWRWDRQRGSRAREVIRKALFPRTK